MIANKIQKRKEIGVEIGAIPATTSIESGSIAKEISKKDIDVLAQYASSIFLGKHDLKIHDKVTKKILPKLFDKNSTEEKDTSTRLKVLHLFGLDTHIPVWESVSNQYGLLAMEFSKGLIKEYDCKTPSEKALAQVTANAYVRVMEYSNTMETGRDKTVKLNLIPYYAVIGKELDRANRHFISNLMALKQMKAPAMKINVNARTAFVAENQQVNINRDEKI